MGVEVDGREGKEGEGERGEDQEVERVGENGIEDFKAAFCCPRQALTELQIYEPNKCRRCFKPSSFGVVHYVAMDDWDGQTKVSQTGLKVAQCPSVTRR